MGQGPSWGTLAGAASTVRTVWKVLSHGGGRCLMNVTPEKMQLLLWDHHHLLRQIGEGEIPWLLPSSHAPVFHSLPLAEPTWRPTDKREFQTQYLCLCDPGEVMNSSLLIWDTGIMLLSPSDVLKRQ